MKLSDKFFRGPKLVHPFQMRTWISQVKLYRAILHFFRFTSLNFSKQFPIFSSCLGECCNAVFP